MKVTFIFPPYINPSCVPIGIASLKAYIKEYLPQTDVSLIDLNLSFVNRILDAQLNNLQYICKGCNLNCPRKEDRCLFQDNMLKEQREIFKKAKRVIKDKRLFFDKEIFKKYVGDCHNYLYGINSCIERIIKKYVEQRLDNDNMIAYLFSEELEIILAEKSDLIGFSILVKSQVPYALALAKTIKQKLRIPVIFGGPALFNLEPVSFMNTFDFVDFMILKEGEESIVSLLRSTSNKKYDNIPNLIWRKGSKTIVNEIKCIENLDTLPTPNFEGLKLNEYFYPEVILPIATSRGCPWSRCKFCQLNIQYSGPYRERSIEKVITDIRHLKKRYNATNFFFTDSEISAQRLKRLGEAIINAKLKIYFACYVRPTKSLNLEVLKTVYKAGGRFFQLGVESFSDRLLRFVNKGTSAESIREILKNTNKLKIKNLVYMLACIPTQTRNELQLDLKRISFMQKKYNIFSVIYCLYSLAIHQNLYAELKVQNITIEHIKPDFNTIDGRAVHSTDMLQFSYKSAGAYDILADPHENRRIISHKDGLDRLLCLRNRFQLNSEDGDFIFNINNFLFETQLLYVKKNNELKKHLLIRKKALKFYVQRNVELRFNLYSLLTKKGGAKMRKKISCLGIVFLLMCFTSSVLFAETIILKSGKKIVADVTDRTEEYIEIDDNGKPVRYFYDEIDSIEGERVTWSSVKKEVPILEDIRNKNFAEVKKAIEKGADVNAKTNLGWAPLMEAARGNSSDIAKLLIQSGADINARDVRGTTALMIATINNSLEVARLLIESGADVNARNNIDWTALMGAVWFNQFDMLKLLIESGAEVNAKNNYRWTALMVAASFNRSDMLKLLLESGADVNVIGVDGKTALSIAEEKGYTEIVKLLKNSGAN